MIHVYKLGGDWEKDGIKYTISCINESLLSNHLKDGWVTSFEELTKKDSAFYRDSLINEIKALGGKVSKSDSLEKLANQFKELKNGSDT